MNRFFLSTIKNASLFFPSSGVVGEPAANASLQLVDAANAPYSVSLSSEWSFEILFKLNDTTEDNDAIYSSNPSVVSNNLFYIAYTSAGSPVAGLWNLFIALYDSSGTVILNGAFNYLFKQNCVDRRNIHLMITQEVSGVGTLLYKIYSDGILSSEQNITTAGPTSLGFNFFCDRNFGTRFTDSKLYLTRFYNGTALSASDVRKAYNNGKLRSALTTTGTTVFDFPLDNLSGIDFPSGSLKLRAVNFTSIASNLVTPVENTTGRHIVFQGNSLTSGQGATPNYYPKKTFEYLKATELSTEDTYFRYLVNALAGRTTPQCITEFNTTDKYLIDKGVPTNIYVPWEVTNDLNAGVSATDAYNNYVTLCNFGKSRGYKVIAVTVLPRISGNPSFETDRQTVNANIVANYLTFAHGLADVGNDPDIGQAGDNSDTTYYDVDEVHLNATGYDVVVEYVGDAILGL